MRDNTNQKQYLPPFPIIDNPDSMDYPLFLKEMSPTPMIFQISTPLCL